MTLKVSTAQARELLLQGHKTQSLGEALMQSAGLTPNKYDAVNVGYTVIRYLRSHTQPATLTLRLRTASAEIVNVA